MSQIEEVDDKKPSKDEKEAEKLAAPEEKPKKRRSIGEKKPKKAEEPEQIELSIDEPDHIQVDGVKENDLKPSSKPSSRRGSKKEPSPEAKTIEVYTLLTATEMALPKLFHRHLNNTIKKAPIMLRLICGRLHTYKCTQ